MLFNNLVTTDHGVVNPYAVKLLNGTWVSGYISVGFLREKFGDCDTLDECIANTESEGLQLFFEYLKTQQ